MRPTTPIPACPWSWAMEPAVRGLQVEFGGSVEIDLVMGGLGRESGARLGRPREWLRWRRPSERRCRSTRRLWLEAGRRPRIPACMAVKAAAEQGDAGTAICAACARASVPAPAPRPRRGASRSGARGRPRRRALSDRPGLARDHGGVRRGPGARAAREWSCRTVRRSGRRGRRRSRTATRRAEPWRAPSATRRCAGGSRLPRRRRRGAVGARRRCARFGTVTTREVAAVCELPGPRAAAGAVAAGGASGRCGRERR